MKKITKQLTAILTAAIMTVSLAGTAYADETPTEAETATADTEAATVSTEAAKYTGWKLENGSWYYFADGEMQTSQRLKIDGVMHSFSERGTYMGKYSGSATENGKSRYYSDGLPIDGWIEVNNEKRYCLDGYSVNGEFSVDGMLYKFNGKGVYTGSSRIPEVSATCGERVCTDAEKLTFTIENLDGKSHEFKIAQSFEYFKDGEWANCKNGTVKYQSLKNGLSKKGEKLSFEVNTREYSKNKFNVGFYRLPIKCGTETYYAVFEAVSPIELKSRKDEYVFANNVKTSGGTVRLDVVINSDKKDMRAENIAGNIGVKLEKENANGWAEVADDIPWEVGYTDSEKRIEIAPEFTPEEGYYRAVVTVGNKNYTDTFRVRNHMAKAWLDEYDLNSKDLTISFTVANCGEAPVKICTFPYGLYQKDTDGVWQPSDIEGAAVEISKDAYTTLESGKKTAINFDLSDYYNMSELKAGEYAVDIGGIGLAEFTLTDKPAEKNLPFKNLKAEDVKEIKIEDAHFWETYTAIIRPGNSKTEITDKKDEQGRIMTAVAQSDSYFDRTINYLQQFEIKNIYKNYETYVGGTLFITVVYKDGTEILLSLETNDAVFYNDKIYHCGRYAAPALKDFVLELTGLTEDSYYGYRNFG